MVFELVKNSLRAVQERFMDLDRVSPPIRIIVADGIEDVTIKVGSSPDRLDFPSSNPSYLVWFPVFSGLYY